MSEKYDAIFFISYVLDVYDKKKKKKKNTSSMLFLRPIEIKRNRVLIARILRRTCVDLCQILSSKHIAMGSSRCDPVDIGYEIHSHMIYIIKKKKCTLFDKNFVNALWP